MVLIYFYFLFQHPGGEEVLLEQAGTHGLPSAQPTLIAGRMCASSKENGVISFHPL